MAGTLPKKDRRCHLVIAYAPEGTTLREANDAVNSFVADPARGLALFHDHFTDRAGGIVLLDVSSPEELAALRDPGPLARWDVRIHPLTFADSALRFLFQCDYTMSTYRNGRRLHELVRDYDAGELRASLDQPS